MTEQTTNAACAAIRQRFPAYLDGAVSGRVMAAVAQHLDVCAGCRDDFAAWRSMEQVLAAALPVRVPSDLTARLRETIAEERARQERRTFANLRTRWTNFLQPILLRASAGLVTTLLMLGGIGWTVGEVAAPGPVLAHDRPLGALTAPHFRYSLARMQPVVTGQDTALVIQAKIDPKGKVYDFHIVSGPDDPATEAQVRDQLMLMVYQPALAFGAPVRGEVLISFSGVSVKA